MGRHTLPIGFNRVNTGKIVTFTKLCGPAPVQNFAQPALLAHFWVVHIMLYTLHAHFQIAFYRFVDEPLHIISDDWICMGEGNELD